MPMLSSSIGVGGIERRENYFAVLEFFIITYSYHNCEVLFENADIAERRLDLSGSRGMGYVKVQVCPSLELMEESPSCVV